MRGTKGDVMSIIGNKLRRLAALAAALFALAAVSGAALAIGTVETETPCSLTVSCIYQDDSVEGMALRLYRVAAVSPSGSYALTPAYAGSGASLDALDDAAHHKETAAALAQYIEENALSPDAEAQTDAGGNAALAALPTGLYLLCADTLSVSGGEYACETTLLALPGRDEAEENWLYARTVFPKLSYTAVKPSPNPGDLPDTGMLQWPVPALALAGVVLLGAGLLLCRRKNDA